MKSKLIIIYKALCNLTSAYSLTTFPLSTLLPVNSSLKAFALIISPFRTALPPPPLFGLSAFCDRYCRVIYTPPALIDLQFWSHSWIPDSQMSSHLGLVSPHLSAHFQLDPVLHPGFLLVWCWEKGCFFPTLDVSFPVGEAP